jgi:uncharacterized protein YjiK
MDPVLSFAASSADIAEVEVSAITFSKDGHKLFTASSEPDFRLVSFCFSQWIFLSELHESYGIIFSKLILSSASGVCKVENHQNLLKVIWILLLSLLVLIQQTPTKYVLVELDPCPYGTMSIISR